MLASRHAVYLSGDFRLTYSSGHFKDDLNIQKIIPVVRYGWGALVAYVGVASYPNVVKDMGEWIREQMDRIAMNGDVKEIPQRLLEANTLFKKMSEKKPHAFSIVGFEGRKPFIMVISNFFDVNGVRTSVRSELKTTIKKPKQSEILVVGDDIAIEFKEREDLKLIMSKNSDYQIIRKGMYQANIRASQRSKLISEQCVTGYLLASGSLEIGPHGINDKESYFPEFVKKDLIKQGIVGFKVKTDILGNHLPLKWIGMTAKIIKDKNTNRNVVLNLYAIRNTKGFVHDGKKHRGTKLFYKIAGKNEPKHYSFKRNSISKKV